VNTIAPDIALDTAPDTAPDTAFDAKPVAWVTGASQGIGRALCLELARRGWHVAASARSLDRLQALADGSASPGLIRAFGLDVRDPSQCEQVLEQITNTWGPVELAVLNAGTHRSFSVKEISVDAVRELLDINVMGTVNVLVPLLRQMQPAGKGRIGVVASLSGYRGLPSASAYGASKAALINLCESLRIELQGSGVIMQVINPGFVKTPLTDQNTFAMPDLISAERAACYIADGLQRDRFEIRFPPRFALMMGLLRHLPYSLYLPLIRRLTRK
jgi:NAD(P)-dependent dehydrogenase (short-subunit alcohol dehydrogenase family)